MQYIDKAAVVAEIEKRLKEYRTYPDYQIDSNYMELCDVLSYIDTLEVKEVDLEKEYEEFVVDDPILRNFITNDTMGMELAKHFFELGIATSNKTKKGE